MNTLIEQKQKSFFENADQSYAELQHDIEQAEKEALREALIEEDYATWEL